MAENRTVEEAWNLALENRGLLYSELLDFINNNRTPWYDRESLKAELEGALWETMFNVCMAYDESKGRLAQFAIVSLRNRLNSEIRKIDRLGGVVRGGGDHSVVEIPRYESFDHLGESDEGEEFDSPTGDEVFTQSIYEGSYQPWQSPGKLMEDEVIDALEEDRFIDAIRDIVARMSEPHKSVFLMAHGLYIERSGPSKTRGTGMTLNEIKKKMGKSHTWVAEKLDQAELYVRNHLEARGFTRRES